MVSSRRSIKLAQVLLVSVCWPSISRAQTAPVRASAAPASSQTAAAPEAPQSDDANSGAEIVVTGIRESLSAATVVKQRSSQFLDAIVASDIGKLPDTNIAESLQRVSGVQIRRALGEGTSVSIRGLRQNRTEVNGRTLANPNGRGRGFDVVLDADYNPLSLFPSELISRLEVTKLLSADQSEGSLGGTVNVITRRPLDKVGQTIALSASGIYSEQAKKSGYQASALYSNSFSEDRFGVLLNLTYSRKPIADQSFNSFVGYSLLTSAFNTTANPRANDPNGDGLNGTYIADLRYQKLSETRERLGANLSLQYKPSDDVEIYADAIYSHLVSNRRRDWLSIALTSNAADYLAYTFSPNEVLVAATVNRPIQSNDERLNVKSDSISMALGAKVQAGRFTFRPELNYNFAQLGSGQTFVRLQTINNATSSFDFRDSNVPQLKFLTNVNLTDPSLFRFANIFDSLFKVRTTEEAARIDVSYDFDPGFLRSIDVGFRYAALKHERASFFSQVASTTPITSRSSSLYEQVRFPGLLNGQAEFATNYLAANPFGTGEQFACVAIGTPCTPRTYNPVQSFTLDEYTSAAYIKSNFSEGPFSGNIGLRYSRTARTVRGTLQAGTTLTPLLAKPTFTDWLPSASFKYEATRNLQFRLGAAKVVGLPDIADLGSGIVLTIAAPFTGSTGNPNLKPFRATQYDAAVEWYYAPGAALTLGLFYKDIKSFVVQKTTIEYPLNPTTAYSILRSYNGDGGKVKGFEVMFQQPFTFLPAPFDGFGVLANFSYIDSKTSLRNTRTGAALPLQGLSKINYNLVGYFEKGGFGTRLAYNYRDKFFDSVSSTGEGVFFAPYRTLDASVRYDFGKFSLFVDASNLTDSAQQRYTGSVEAKSLYAVQGRRYSAGVSARF